MTLLIASGLDCDCGGHHEVAVVCFKNLQYLLFVQTPYLSSLYGD